MKGHRHTAGLVLPSLLLLLVLVGCGASNTGSPGAGATPGASNGQTALAGAGATAAVSGKKVGLVLSGPVGVNNFLKAIKDGVEQAGKEAGVKTTVIESRDIPAIEGNLRRLVQEHYDLVACNSFECVDALKKVAPANPSQKFLIIDATVDAPNVSSAVFREHESAFLVGSEVAMVSKAKKVGFVGAQEIPLLHRWSDGYKQGIDYVDKSVDVQVAWTGSFTDIAKAKELAVIEADKGADIIFPAAGGIVGVFEAAKTKGFKVVGVDTDYREQFPDVCIDSQLKRTDVVMHDSVKAFLNGSLQPGVKSYGLKENGVGLASLSKPNAISDKALGSDVIKRLKEIQDKIISGEIKVKDPLEQQK